MFAMDLDCFFFVVIVFVSLTWIICCCTVCELSTNSHIKPSNFELFPDHSSQKRMCCGRTPYERIKYEEKEEERKKCGYGISEWMC